MTGQMRSLDFSNSSLSSRCQHRCRKPLKSPQKVHQCVANIAATHATSIPVTSSASRDVGNSMARLATPCVPLRANIYSFLKAKNQLRSGTHLLLNFHSGPRTKSFHHSWLQSVINSAENPPQKQINSPGTAPCDIFAKQLTSKGPDEKWLN